MYSVLECSQCKFGLKEEFMRKMSISKGRFGKWKMSSMNSINLHVTEYEYQDLVQDNSANYFAFAAKISLQ